jgi:uncharacterized protein
MGKPEAVVIIPAELRMFLRASRRADRVAVPCDGVSTIGHLVESLGVPRTEVGSLTVNGHPEPHGYLPRSGDVIEVRAVARPQPLEPARFVLDVHLGALARRLRLIGLDTAYANDAADDDLVSQANAQRRVLLTQDRGLLCRRKLWAGAYVHGARPDDQLVDVLDRFVLPLAPWTRCTACNGRLQPVAKPAVESVLEPGTRRTYHEFAQCQVCDRVYWHGAHAARLQAIVDGAASARQDGAVLGPFMGPSTT